MIREHVSMYTLFIGLQAQYQQLAVRQHPTISVRCTLTKEHQRRRRQQHSTADQ